MWNFFHLQNVILIMRSIKSFIFPLKVVIHFTFRSRFLGSPFWGSRVLGILVFGVPWSGSLLYNMLLTRSIVDIRLGSNTPMSLITVKSKLPMMIGTVNFQRLFTCKYKKSSNTYICLYCFDFLKGILLFLEGFTQGIDFLKIK